MEKDFCLLFVDKNVNYSKCLSYFSQCCDKIYVKGNLRKEMVIFAHSLKVQFFTVSNSCWQEPETAGFIVYTARKLIVINMGTEFASSTISFQDFSLQNSATLFYGRSHCFKQLSRNSFTSIPKCLSFGKFRICKVDYQCLFQKAVGKIIHKNLKQGYQTIPQPST